MDAKTAEKESKSFLPSLSDILRPYAPNLLSLVVCICAIPLLIILSLSAGFYVWKNIAVSWQVPLYLQYGDGVQPYARAVLPALDSRQPYDIMLQLQIPATQSNFDLGNFMTRLAIMTSNNKTIAAVRRPAIVLSPRSTFLSRTPNVISVEVPMLTSFVPGTTQAEAQVYIGREDSWKGIGTGNKRELSVVSATLKGVIVHQGIRGLATRFPNVSPLFAAALFYAILFSILSVFMLPSILHKSPSGDQSERPQFSADKSEGALPVEDVKPELSLGSEDEEIEVAKRSRRKRRKNPQRSSSRESQSIQSESDSILVSSADEPTPLRRRRSRPSNMDS